jgi:threonine synthase
MQFCSTRDNAHTVPLSQALLTGLSEDGGLYFPTEIPKISEKERTSFSHISFADTASLLFQKFSQNCFSAEDISRISHRVYSSQVFSDPEIAPVRKIERNTFLLELFHGPTGAFKDFALQFLPHLISQEIQKKGGNERCILVATSGDTGAAALSGFAHQSGVRCIVFFPKGGVSYLQQAQMQCVQGENVAVFEIDADFDMAQSAVKILFTDNKFSQELLSAFNVSLSSANSINVGRFLPQIFYVFSAHAQMVKNREISPDEKIDVCVPTGNFGDLFAVFLAKKMGLPLGKLICASNTNNTSALFFQTGIFDVRHRITQKTYSPAMDILRASNLERLLFWASQKDSDAVVKWEKSLQDEGYFEVDSQTFETIKEDFCGETVSDAETAHEIQRTFFDTGYLSDPHTAVALRAGKKYRDKKEQQTKMLVFSTAHYGKFGKTVFSSLFPEMSVPTSEEEVLRVLQKRAKFPRVPQHFFDTLCQKRVHTRCISGDISAMKRGILDFLESRGV